MDRKMAQPQCITIIEGVQLFELIAEEPPP